MKIIHIRPDDVVVGKRHRKEMGDIEALAESMDRLGLLQPIIVTPDHRLIAGERRLRAARRLGWATIAARVHDLDSLIEGEHDENVIRKDFTVEERVAIGRAVEAEIGKRQGQRTDLGGELRQKFAEVEPGERTADVAAREAGFGNRETYRQAKAVVEHGPPELVEAMNRGEISVSAARRRMLELFGPMPLSFGDESQEMLDRAADYPSPERAREIARETDTPVLASDLWIYPPETEERFHRDRLWNDLRRGLFAPDVILPDPADAVAAVPEFMADEVRHMAAERIAWLRAFGRAARV